MKIKNFILISYITSLIAISTSITAQNKVPQRLPPDHRENKSIPPEFVPRMKRIPYVENEFIIRFKDNISMQQSKALIQSKGALFTKNIGPGKSFQMYLAKIPQGKSMESVIQEYSQNPDVSYVQPNYIYSVRTIPNDTSYGNLWGLKNIGQMVNGTTGTSGYDIEAETAWNTITDCSSAIVAVIDSGVNYNHEDLSTNIWANPGETVNGSDDDGNGLIDDIRGWDYVDGDNNPMDMNGHGTHVSGTIGANGNNSTGVTGVCWKTKIMPLRVLDASGSGTTSDIVQAIYYANKKGAKVINASFGGGGFDTALSNAIGDETDPDSCISKGVVFAAAAGNENMNNEIFHSYPSDFTHANIISVASMNQNGKRSSFSNYGSKSVDIAAPGSNIMSSWFATPAIIMDDFSTGWISSVVSSVTGWELNTTEYPFYTFVDPGTLYSGGNYDDDSDDRLYKIFDLSAYDGATLSGLYTINTEFMYDFFLIATNSTGGDPFAGGGSLLYMDTGPWGPNFWYYQENINSSCLTANCSIGYQLTSDSSYTYSGVSLAFFMIDAFTNSNTGYNTISGTSMATPHVAGIATMVRARNPNFTYQDTIAAIYSGGVINSAFKNKTTQGKHANAANALKYIPQSEIVSAVSP